MLHTSIRGILTVPLALLLVTSVQGTAIRTVLYHEGVIENDDTSSSSSFEDIPPREEWFRVRGDSVPHNQPKALEHGMQDIVALPSTRTGARNVSRVDPGLPDLTPIDNNNQRRIQVHVRNRGKIGFQNSRDATEDEQGTSGRFGGDSSDFSRLPSISSENGQKNWYQRIRHENGHHKVGQTDRSSNDSKEDVPLFTDDEREIDTYSEDEDPAILPSAIQSEEQGEPSPIKILSSSRPNVPVKHFGDPNDIDTVDDGPPPPPEVALMARYIVHNSNWTSIATISTMSPVTGYPFVNVFSVSDGPINNSTGVPYMYVTPLDMSVTDLQNDPRASLTMSLAQSDYCKQQEYDPEDPRCAHVILSGQMQRVTKPDEIQFAKNAVFSRHAEMKSWPKDHGWFFAKLKMEHIVVLDYFGGAKTVSVDDYFKQSANVIKTMYQ